MGRIGRTLFLHIGSGKTGTTSTQKFFQVNRGEFLKRGLLYPGEDIAQHSLYYLFNDDESRLPRTAKKLSSEDIEGIKRSALDKISKELQDSVSDVLISSEYLGSADSKFVRRALDFFHGFFSDIRVIFFVRDPVDFYVSSTQQKIKASSRPVSPVEFYYRFKAVIEEWEKWCKVDVIRYDASVDTIGKIQEIINFDSAGLEIPNRVNASMSIQQMLLLEKIQASLYSNKEDFFKPHFSRLIGFRHKGAARPIILPEVRDFLYCRHGKDSAWLRERYGVIIQPNVEYARIDPDFNLKFAGHVRLRDIFSVDEAAVELFELEFLDSLLRLVHDRLTKQ